MPLLNGKDMISRLATERYPARYLLISGYGEDHEVRSGLSFLSKPFTSSQLMEAVERLQQEPTLAELERAWLVAKGEWQESIRESKEILSGVPSEIPHPDGALRIERDALNGSTLYERYFQTFEKYKEALRACGVFERDHRSSESYWDGHQRSLK
jgi:YesN/AraC family two-component response regulator